MLVAIWNMCSTRSYHSDPGEDFFARLDPDRAKSRALAQLRRVGYTVTLESFSTAG
jgi:hypothetical protein